MSEHLIVDLEAPLMSFGKVSVDATNPTAAYPGRSLITGMLANALGWTHDQVDGLSNLQSRLHLAVRADRPGTWFEDYQTVDLGQAHLVNTGWTWAGARHSRGGGSAKGTHIRKRAYRADARVLVAIGLAGGPGPSVPELANALLQPCRPLFIGRKPCVPSRQIYLTRIDAPTPRDALLRVPWLPEWSPSGGDPVLRGAAPHWSSPDNIDLWSPASEPDDVSSIEIVYDRRDWANQIHTGRRFVRREQVRVCDLPREVSCA